MSIIKHKFKANLLKKNGIDNLIKEIRQYQNSLQSKVNEIARRLSLLGVSYAISNILDYKALFTGELIASIDNRIIQTGNNQAIYAVVADSEHAAFVEFGTGWKGLGHPYPVAVPQGNYGGYTGYVSGSQIIANAKKGIYGWYYQDENGNWYFTQGMPSRPFMYETSEQLYNIASRIVREVFREMR